VHNEWSFHYRIIVKGRPMLGAPMGLARGNPVFCAFDLPETAPMGRVARPQLKH
jgi:hypothetical protein